MEACGVERLVHIDIAQTGKNRLVQQKRFEPSATGEQAVEGGVLQLRVQGLRAEGGGHLPGILEQADAPEGAGIVKAQLPSEAPPAGGDAVRRFRCGAVRHCGRFRSCCGGELQAEYEPIVRITRLLRGVQGKAARHPQVCRQNPLRLELKEKIFPTAQEGSDAMSGDCRGKVFRSGGLHGPGAQDLRRRNAAADDPGTPQVSHGRLYFGQFGHILQHTQSRGV